MKKKFCQTCQKEVTSSNWSRHLDEIHGGKAQPFTLVKVQGIRWWQYGIVGVLLFFCCSSFLGAMTMGSVLAYQYFDTQWLYELVKIPMNGYIETIENDFEKISNYVDIEFQYVFPRETYDRKSIFVCDKKELQKELGTLSKDERESFCQELHKSTKTLKKTLKDLARKCHLAQDVRPDPEHRAIHCTSDDLRKQFLTAVKDETEDLKLEKFGVTFRGPSNNNNNDHHSDDLPLEQHVDAIVRDIMQTVTEVGNTIERDLHTYRFSATNLHSHHFVPYKAYLLTVDIRAIAQRSLSEARQMLTRIATEAKNFGWEAASLIKACRLGLHLPQNNFAYCNANLLKENLLARLRAAYPDLITAQVHEADLV